MTSDAIGLLLHALVHPADIQDRDDGDLVLKTLFGRYPFLKKLFADGGYQGLSSPRDKRRQCPDLPPQSSSADRHPHCDHWCAAACLEGYPLRTVSVGDQRYQIDFAFEEVEAGLATIDSELYQLRKDKPKREAPSLTSSRTSRNRTPTSSATTGRSDTNGWDVLSSIP
jgi:hypothetical protein